MTASVVAIRSRRATRVATRREYLMCPPRYFEVTYAINEWMRTDVPVDRDLAMAQWRELVATYRRLGHTVHTIEPVPGLPDMVFAANGAVIVDGHILGARFRHPERAAEAPAYRRWFAECDLGTFHAPDGRNEGEGDFTVVGDVILAGTGFRTDHAAHAEAQEVFGRPVVSVGCAGPSTTTWTSPCSHSTRTPSPTTRRPSPTTAGACWSSVPGRDRRRRGRRQVLRAELRLRRSQRRHRPGRHRTHRAAHRARLPAVSGRPVRAAKAGGGAKCCTQEIRRQRTDDDHRNWAVPQPPTMGDRNGRAEPGGR